MWKRQLSIFFTGCNATLAAQLYEWLSKDVQVNVILAMLVSAVTAAFSQGILEFLFFEAPLSFRSTRQFIDPVSRVEGYWIEEICQGQNCHYSYARIEYADKGKYRYYGLSYEFPNCKLDHAQSVCENPALRAYFDSGLDEVHLVGDSSSVKMYYSFKAKLFKFEHNQTHDSTGYGQINFYSDGTQEFNRGEGYFVDNTGKIVEMGLVLTRIPDKEAKKIMPSPNYFYNEAIKALVVRKVNELIIKHPADEGVRKF